MEDLGLVFHVRFDFFSVFTRPGNNRIANNCSHRSGTNKENAIIAVAIMYAAYEICGSSNEATDYIQSQNADRKEEIGQPGLGIELRYDCVPFIMNIGICPEKNRTKQRGEYENSESQTEVGFELGPDKFLLQWKSLFAHIFCGF
jgi:hypothetical protein